MYKSKNQLVRELVSKGEYRKALGICKDWDRGITAEDRNLMRTAYECMHYTRFYKELGYNTDYIITQGIKTLKKYYGKGN